MPGPSSSSSTPEPPSPTPEEIGRNVTALIRGLTENDAPEMYRCYKALFEVGTPAIPQIRAAIFKSGWSRVRYPNEIRYVAGLVALVHDLDESESADVRAALKRGGCDPALARILDSIGRFTLGDYVRYDVRGIQIFEHRRLATRQRVTEKLERWLTSVPHSDLDQIARIYVLRSQDLGDRGNYLPVLCCINLVWDNRSPRWSPMSWVNNLAIEGTLYHEIGHHVHRHTFGVDPVQEHDATAYADRIMVKRSRHLLFRVARWLKRALRRSPSNAAPVV